MKISVRQNHLAKALSTASRVSSSRTGLPILGSILLRTDSNQLVVAATNLELASITRLGVKITEPGEIAVPAKIISDYVGSLPGENVDISTDGNNITIKCGTYISTIHGVSTEEFPELPIIDNKNSDNYKIDSSLFKQSINQTLFATSSDTTRPVLTGLYWNTFESELYMVGTDGYRLAEKKIMKINSDIDAIIPSQTLLEVTRAVSDDTDNINVSIDETQINFKIGDTEIISKLIDGNYPNYRSLIPGSSEVSIEVDVTELSRMVKISSLFARDTGGSVILSADDEKGTLSIRSIETEVGESNTEINANVSGNGEVSLNSKYLNEVISVIDSKTANISFSGKLSPLVIKPNDNYVHIIMPMKS